MKWSDLFKEVSKKGYFKKLEAFVGEERDCYTIYPEEEDMYKAFEVTPFEDVKVVIFGQDPYVKRRQAMGLAFSVRKGVKIPPSLQNIFKEIELEYDSKIIDKSGDLTYLAEQGVLLLNTILTVRKNKPLSHDIKEYELLIDDVIKAIEQYNDKPVVYLLFGNKAKKFIDKITNKKHTYICVSHPSPLSANQGGWFGSNVFKDANKYLVENGETEIKWLK